MPPVSLRVDGRFYLFNHFVVFCPLPPPTAITVTFLPRLTEEKNVDELLILYGGPHGNFILIEGRGARLLKQEYDNDGKIIITINSAILKVEKKKIFFLFYLFDRHFRFCPIVSYGLCIYVEYNTHI